MVTNFENLKKMSLEDLAEWLDENGVFDGSPWSEFFNKEYCEKCEAIKCNYVDAKETLGIQLFSYGDSIECAHCEIYGKCKFFPEFDDVPDNKTVIKLWLEEEAE